MLLQFSKMHGLGNDFVVIDSPLAIKATRIYPKYNRWFNQATRYLIAKGDDVFKFNGLKFTRRGTFI